MLDPSPELALRHTDALASLTVEALVDHPLELLIQHALDVAAAALGERAATLSESVPKTGTLDVREVVGLPDAEGLRCDADASNALGSCLSGRRPVLVSDWRCEERYEWPQALRRAGVHSTLAVPVLAGPWQGVLAVHSAAPGRFTSESVKPLEEVTRVLAAGLRRAHLEELVQSRAQQHAALAELGRLTLTDMPADELLGRGAELVAAAMGAAVVTVSGRDPDDSVHVRAVHPPDLASAESWLGDGASATVPDWSLADRGPATPAEQSVRSSIAARTGPHGMLAVHFRDPHERDTVDARLVEVCASMLAGAVERSNAQRRMAMTAVTASVAADVAAGSGTAVETRRRRAAASMLRAGEAERERIASELHDDTVQEMAAILITLDRVVKAASRGDPETASRTAAQARATLATTTERARRLLFELRPPLLDLGGLGPAVRGAAEQAARDQGFTVTVRADVGRYPQPVEALVYRTMCGLIANAGAHSSARSLAVELSERDGDLIGRVEDDGVGFDVESVLAGGGSPAFSSLEAMRGRIELAGGQLDIDSAPGRGTTATLSLPTA